MLSTSRRDRHMNTMHIKWKALAVAGGLAFVALAGCTDLTVQPKSSVTSANIFNDPSAYQEYLARIYAGLAVSGQQGPAGAPDIQGIDEGFSQYLRLYWECQELPTDEAVIAWGDIGLPEMNTATWTSSSRMVVAMYYRIYVQAVMANDFLRQTTAAALASHGTLSPTLLAQIQSYRAQARWLRAFSYWNALDLFGNVPLVTEANQVGGPPPGQVTRQQLYTYVVNELTAIYDSLPVSGTSGTMGEATQQADNMLLAELYLNAGVYTGTPDWTDAMNAAAAVIGSNVYSLQPTFSHLFNASNRNSSEIIFPIESDGQNTQTWGGVTFIIHAGCGGSMSASSYGIDYCWGGTRIKPQADSLFNVTADHPAGDVRGSMIYTSGQTLGVANISNFNDGYGFPKFTNLTNGGARGSNPTFVDTWFPVFRLGEAYLIYAEACLRSGGGACAAQALTYVNDLRQRAYGNTSGNITAAQLTLPFILAERGRELMWEAHRRTDLIRYGLFGGANSGNYLWAWKGGVAGGQALSADYNLYPLPGSELTANPNLKQNPGY